MKNKHRLFIVVSLIVLALEGAWMVYMGNGDADENWWFYGAAAVAQGKLPHFDFLSHHNPLTYYAYAVPQYLFGSSMIVGRLTSLAFLLGTFFLTLRLCYRMGGAAALYLCSSLFVINLFSIYKNVLIHYQASQTFLLVALVSVLFSDLTTVKKAFFTPLIAVLLIGVRYNCDYVILLFGLYLAWTLGRLSKAPVEARVTLATAFAALLLLWGPHLLMGPERFFFNTVTYLLDMGALKAGFGLAGYSLMTDFIMRLEWIKATANNYMPVLVLLTWLGLVHLERFIEARRRDGAFSLPGDPRYALIAAFIGVTFVFYLIPHSSDLASLVNFVFPLMVFLASVGFAQVLSDSTPGEPGIQKRWMPATLVAFSFLLQIPVGVQNSFAYSWARADMKNIGDVAARIRALVPERGPIVTSTPLFVAEADREVLAGQEMEYSSFFPTWSTEKAKRYRLLNWELLRDAVGRREAAALVLTERRFFNSMNYSRILDPYRKELLELIDRNYYVAETVEAPSSVWQGNTFIYLPRRDR
ncbi:MAG: hypothetical protein HY554_06735 [Elusimicrobia bacterium]|nr:hypothetical protein [Elusimicrobiota bacterium]